MKLSKTLVAGAFLLVPVHLVAAGGHVDAKKHVAAKEYDFRGAVLGMPLADFRALPFPELSVEPGAKAFCSGDEETKDLKNGIYFFSIGEADQAAGITECAYYKPRGYAGDMDMGWEEATMSVGTHGASKRVTYDFVVDPKDKVPRLYSIVVLAYAIGAESAMEGSREKFGPPFTVTHGTVQNRMGASFAHTLATWVNPLSMVVFDDPAGDVDSMALSYRELRLGTYVDGVKKKIEGPSSSKM